MAQGVSKYPLIFQGFAGNKVAALSEGTNSFDTAVDRGSIKAIMPFTNFAAEDTQFSLSVGGRPTYLNETFFNINLAGKQNDGYRKRLLFQEGGQTIQLDTFNNNPLSTIQAFVGVYYTTPEYDKWLSEFKFRDENNLKEQNFRFVTTGGSPLLRLFDPFTIPKNQGEIVGVRFNVSYLVTDVAAADLRLNFLVNGETVIQNLPGSVPSIGSDPTIQRFFLPIEPGSQGQLGVIDPAGGTRIDVSLIFNGYGRS